MFCAATVSLSVVCAADEAASPPRSSLPAVACQFVTSIDDGNESDPTKREWRLWRSETEVETQEVGDKDGEVWIRNPQGQITYFRVFHPERRAIEYQPVDLSMAKSAPQWDRLQSVISPDFLTSNLKRTGEEKVLDRTATRYEGEVDGSRFEVLWLDTEQLPALVRETREKHVSTITLTELHPLQESPWPFGLRKDYEIIDYADLGDKESDPALRQMLQRGAPGSGHAHRH